MVKMKESQIKDSHRQQKVASLIKQAIIESLRKGRIEDARLIDSPLTITKVLVSADLRVANCYIVPFNKKLTEHDLIDALEKSKYSIRAFVTAYIKLRYSPEIRFHIDHGFKNADMVQQLLL